MHNDFTTGKGEPIDGLNLHGVQDDGPTSTLLPMIIEPNRITDFPGG